MKAMIWLCFMYDHVSAKTRELALGNVSGPARRCIVELGLDQNLVGWRPATPSVLTSDLEQVFTKRCERGVRRIQLRVQLDVIAWWFWKSSGVCEIVLVRMGSGRLRSSVLSDEFGSLGTNTNYSSYWGTPLGIADYRRGKFIPGVESRDVQTKSWKLRIKDYDLQGWMLVSPKESNALTGFCEQCSLIQLSSPYLVVFGDDRVMRYMRVDEVTGGAGEA
ncbi:hypothetical protein DEO72_LG10g2331 [Vigna unguiculata]|uniref:Uncharacterized protein n=1 Tax=Vigna unguiculata TaxID=3917 RepID=A0A4D6NCR4_VIGUN|nr:hypothetical protein DEO72_LG10g2331 [Vigna unguiculata]